MSPKIAEEKKTILIIEDEPDLMDILQEVFQKNFNILKAEDGKKGLEMIRDFKPTLILTDFFMPRLNGLELLKILKEENIKIPVIWITGYACPELIRDAWTSGVFDFFEKPLNFKDLKSAVDVGIFWGESFNVNRRPNWVSRMVAKEVVFSIYNENYKKLIKVCEARGISITSFLNNLIESELKKTYE